MPVQASDISIVLSGGSFNADINLSLGGNPSSTPLIGTLNNLFDNISEEQSLSGITDYRCFYIFNDNDNDTFYNVKVWIESQIEGGAEIFLGIPIETEIQKVVMTGNITGGEVIFSHENYKFLVQGNPNLTIMAQNFQNALNGTTGVSGVVVTSDSNSGTNNFTITFESGRNHPLIQLVDNALVGTSIDIFIQRIKDGGPINKIASPIDNKITIPAGIFFSKPTKNFPISVGNLRKLEGFPVWVKRFVAPNTTGLNNDGTIIRVAGKPFLTNLVHP